MADIELMYEKKCNLGEVAMPLHHSSEIGGLCLMKWPSEILQNLPYFMYKKTHVFFSVFHLMNALLYVDIDGHSLGKNIKLHETKKRKKLCGFSYT